MFSELTNLAEWKFLSECRPPSDAQELLTEGESILCAFKTIRDVAMFTNKRIIVRDMQGLTGRKVYNLPYSSIYMYSVENARAVDLDSELELLTRAGVVKITLTRNCDMQKADKIIAEAVLG